MQRDFEGAQRRLLILCRADRSGKIQHVALAGAYARGIKVLRPARQ
jgi:hypothetical protein